MLIIPALCAILLHELDGSPDKVVDGLRKLSSHLVPSGVENANLQGSAAKVLGPVELQFLRVVRRNDEGELFSGILRNPVAVIDNLNPAVELVGQYKDAYVRIDAPKTLTKYAANVKKIVEALQELPSDQKFGSSYRPYWIARMRNVAAMGQAHSKGVKQKGGCISCYR